MVSSLLFNYFFFFMWAFCFQFCLSSGIKSLIRLHNPICFSGPLWWCNKENHECHSGARSAESHLWPWLPELWTVGCSKREERWAQHLSWSDADPWSSFPFWTQTWLVRDSKTRLTPLQLQRRKIRGCGFVQSIFDSTTRAWISATPFACVIPSISWTNTMRRR